MLLLLLLLSLLYCYKNNNYYYHYYYYTITLLLPNMIYCKGSDPRTRQEPFHCPPNVTFGLFDPVSTRIPRWSTNEDAFFSVSTSRVVCYGLHGPHLNDKWWQSIDSPMHIVKISQQCFWPFRILFLWNLFCSFLAVKIRDPQTFQMPTCSKSSQPPCTHTHTYTVLPDFY